MKRKPDDYYNNGLFEVARIGNSIIQKNIMLCLQCYGTAMRIVYSYVSSSIVPKK